MTPESKIKKEITAYLDSLGERCWWTSIIPMGYGKRGVPDILVCYKGRFLALEVKADETKKPTAWQLREIDAIGQAGGNVCVVWSVAQVKSEIEEINKELATYEPDDL